MASTIKVLSSEIALSNTVGNTVGGAVLVRLLNTDASTSSVISLTYANGSVKATTTLGHKATDTARLVLVKDSTDKLLSGGAVTVLATSVAYSV